MHDELGVVRGERGELYEAMESATSGQLAPLSVIISTQGRRDNDLLSQLIDHALSGADPRTICLLYTAPPDADPCDIATIRLANPAIGVLSKPRGSHRHGPRC
jgi:hypothetical protein